MVEIFATSSEAKMEIKETLDNYRFKCNKGHTCFGIPSQILVIHNDFGMKRGCKNTENKKSIAPAANSHLSSQGFMGKVILVQSAALSLFYFQWND